MLDHVFYFFLASLPPPPTPYVRLGPTSGPFRFSEGNSLIEAGTTFPLWIGNKKSEARKNIHSFPPSRLPLPHSPLPSSISKTEFSAGGIRCVKDIQPDKDSPPSASPKGRDFWVVLCGTKQCTGTLTKGDVLRVVMMTDGLGAFLFGTYFWLRPPLASSTDLDFPLSKPTLGSSFLSPLPCQSSRSHTGTRTLYLPASFWRSTSRKKKLW